MKKITVTTIIDLVQGGKGFLVYIPLYIRNSFGGFISGVFRHREFFDILFSTLEIPEFSVVIFDGEEEIFRSFPFTEPNHQKWSRKVAVNFYDKTWEMHIWPQKEFLSRSKSLLPEIVQVIGILWAFFIAAIIYYARLSFFHSKEVESVNRELEHIRNELEIRVRERTMNLKTANDQLAIFRKFADTSGLGIVMTTLDLETVYVNPTLLSLVGETKPDAMIGKSFLTYYPEYHREHMKNVIIPVILQHGEWTAESALLSSGNSIIPTIENTFLLYDDQETPLYFASVITDITMQKQTEDSLFKTKEQLQSILDSAPAIIYLKDLEGRFLLVNSVFEKFLKLTKDQIIGKSDYDLFPKEIADAFRFNDQKVIETQQAVSIEEVTPQDEGNHTYMSLKFPMFDSRTGLYGVCGIFSDITERKRMEEEVVLLQSLTCEIATAHDLESAIENTLREVVRVTGWVYGEAWLPNDENTHLVCGRTWYSSEERFNRFYEQSNAYVFERGQGLQGYVWESKKPIWYAEVTSAQYFLRKELAIHLV